MSDTTDRFTIRWDIAMGCYRVSTPEFQGPLEVVPAADLDRLRLLLRRAIPLAGYAVDIPRRELEAVQWEEDARAALAEVSP